MARTYPKNFISNIFVDQQKKTEISVLCVAWPKIAWNGYTIVIESWKNFARVTCEPTDNSCFHNVIITWLSEKKKHVATSMFKCANGHHNPIRTENLPVRALIMRIRLYVGVCVFFCRADNSPAGIHAMKLTEIVRYLAACVCELDAGRQKDGVNALEACEKGSVSRVALQASDRFREACLNIISCAQAWMWNSNGSVVIMCATDTDIMMIEVAQWPLWCFIIPHYNGQWCDSGPVRQWWWISAVL